MTTEPTSPAIDNPAPAPSPAEAAEARIAAAGALDDTTATPSETDDDDLLSIVPDDISYRDAHKLRQELKADRERWAPLEKSFGQMDEADRQAIAELAPVLGGDLASTAQVFANLSAPDRQAFLALADALVNDPAQAQQMFDQAAQNLKARLGGAPPLATPPGDPASPTAGSGAPGSDEPFTRAQWEAAMAEREQQWASQAAEAEARQTIHAQVRDLGYDPESADPIENARYLTLVQLAVNLDGNLARAHETLSAERERTIAEYLDGKRADARRVAPNADVGTGPSPDARPLETLQDARSAAEARLDAAFGGTSR